MKLAFWQVPAVVGTIVYRRGRPASYGKVISLWEEHRPPASVFHGAFVRWRDGTTTKEALLYLHSYHELREDTARKLRTHDAAIAKAQREIDASPITSLTGKPASPFVLQTLEVK